MLQSCSYGTRLLNSFKEKRNLNQDDKKVLTDVITEHFMSKQEVMSLSQIKFYSEQIEMLFPTESKVCCLCKFNIPANTATRVFKFHKIRRLHCELV